MQVILKIVKQVNVSVAQMDKIKTFDPVIIRSSHSAETLYEISKLKLTTT